MQLKVWFTLTLLLTSVFSLASVASVNSWHTPASTDDGKFEQFGPRPSQLLIKVYANYAAELAGFEAKEFDIFDVALDPYDYAHFESIDPTHSQYATAFFNEFGLWEYDTNDAVFPTSSIAFRQALSHIIDKDDFIRQAYLTTIAAKSDSILAPNPGWYDPSLTDLYNLQPRTYAGNVASDSADWEAAYNLLQSVFGAPAPDPINGGLMYGWVQQAPLNAPDANGIYPAEPDNTLLVYARSDSYPWRMFQGQYLKNLLEVVMPATFAALGHPAIHINVDNRQVPRGGPGGCSQQVMFLWRYHLYTGGWSFGRDPDSVLTLFLAPGCYYCGGRNYQLYVNPDYDYEVNAALTATDISDARYHVYRAQDIFMNDAGIIPLFMLGGNKAYLANWRGVVNEAGFGVNSWWTSLNAHTVGSQGGDIIRYGWEADAVSLNVVTAQWYFDWQVLSKIYDSLIVYNPYDVSTDLPYIASGWTIGSNALGNTVLNFTIRDDVFWQDIPFHDRSSVAVGGGHQIDGPFTNVQFTPVDVAFTFEYIRDNYNAWNQLLASPVDYVILNPMWKSLWPYNATYKPPWYTGDAEFNITWQGNYVRFSQSVSPNDIMVVLNQPMTWVGLHWIGSVPLMPMHLWSQITQYKSESADFVGEDLLYGTGPYIFLNRVPGVSLSMISYVAGQSYRGLILQNSYFYQPVGESGTASVEMQGQSVIISDTLYNNAPVQMNLSLSYSVDVREEVGDTWIPVLGLPSSVWTGEVNIPPFGTQTVSIEIKLVDLTFGAIIGAGGDFNWTYNIRGSDPWTWLAPFIGQSHPAGFPSDYGRYAPGDVNGSGAVDISDAALIGKYWEQTVPPAPTNVDINGDGIVDIGDAAILASNWHKRI